MYKSVAYFNLSKGTCLWKSKCVSHKSCVPLVVDPRILSVQLLPPSGGILQLDIVCTTLNKKTYAINKFVFPSIETTTQYHKNDIISDKLANRSQFKQNVQLHLTYM